MQDATPVDFLNQAIAKAKGQSALAAGITAIRADGKPITAARVWNWVSRDKRAPAEFCPDIEALTGIKCEELRPDVNWAVLRTKRGKSRAIKAQAAINTVATQEA